jgi:putative transposase
MRRYRETAPETIFHITSRGNGQRTIFFDDQDRLYFTYLLGRVTREMDWLCHAYSLMDNHYHLLLGIHELNLSSGMQLINGQYARTFNARHGKSGHLFQDRFDSNVVDSDAYFMIAAGYIVLNPVKADIVRHPASWPWSSYAQTADGIAVAEFVTAEVLLSLFSDEIDSARAEYKEFVGAWLQIMLEEKHLKAASEKSAVMPERPELEDIFRATNRHSNELIGTAYFEHGYKLREIADFLRLSTSGVARIVNSLKKKV